MNIENKKQFATILLAVGLGLVAAFLTSQFVQTNIQTQTSNLAKEYNKNTGSMIQEVERLKAELSNVIARQEELAQKQQMMPKMITQAQAGKDPVAVKAFSINTPPGKRALTLQFDYLDAVGGLIHVGDFVDVIGHLDMPTGETHFDKKENKEIPEKEMITTMLFQNIQVLAIDTKVSPVDKKVPASLRKEKPTKKLDVTLSVSPEEAGLMSFAKENGKLRLVLRSPAESQNWQLKTATWDSLSEFLMEQQGTELYVPQPEPKIIDAVGVRTQTDEVGDFIEIFRGGRQEGDD